MSQRQQTSSLFLLILVASLQISCFDCLPTSPTQDQLPAQGSSPSPSQANCSEHQTKYNPGSASSLCDIPTVMSKLRAGTLQYSDVEYCYRPQCDPAQRTKYLLKQCFLQGWCWCSNSDGSLVSGTFQKNMPSGYCVEVQRCEVDGTFYDIGATFSPSNGCGRCECHSNGTHTCYVEYTVDENNHLSSDQLESLKGDLIRLFKLQHAHQDDPTIDVQKIYKEPLEVSDDEKNTVLSWKFTVYDKNEDGVLNRVEEFVFHGDLASLFGCSKFFGQLNELMDENKDHVVSPEEWKGFFGVVTSDGQSSGEMPTQHVVAKREALRRPLNLRKKFPYYIA